MLLIPGIIGSAAPQIGDFESIQTHVVGSGGTPSITFTSIPTDFQHLQIRASLLGSTSTGQDVIIRFNSDTTSSYNWHRLYGTGASALAQGVGSVTSMYFAADAARDTFPAVAVIDILDYKDTNKNKTIRNLSGYDQNGSGSVALWSGLWRNTTAISSITISVAANNFAQHSSFALYGIRG